MNKNLVLLMAILGLSFAGFAKDDHSPAQRSFNKTLVDVEIAVNTVLSQLAESSFYIEGYLYPVGTLAESEHGGVLDDGSAEFPELVVGRWTCTGWLALARNEGEIPVGAFTTQAFEFNGAEQGEDMIITTGFEPGAFGPVYTRAVTGATGMYADANGGEQKITVVGINDVGGVNYRTSIDETFTIRFKGK